MANDIRYNIFGSHQQVESFMGELHWYKGDHEILESLWNWWMEKRYFSKKQIHLAIKLIEQVKSNPKD